MDNFLLLVCPESLTTLTTVDELPTLSTNVSESTCDKFFDINDELSDYIDYTSQLKQIESENDSLDSSFSDESYNISNSSDPNSPDIDTYNVEITTQINAPDPVVPATLTLSENLSGVIMDDIQTESQNIRRQNRQNIAERIVNFRGGEILNPTSKAGYYVKCHHGHRWLAKFEKLLKGQWCDECTTHTRLKIMQDAARKKGGKCLAEAYKGVFGKIEWMCKRGHVWMSSYQCVVTNKSWCPVCCGHAPVTIESMHKIAEIRGGKLLSKHLTRSLPLIWECSEGHKFKTTIDQVKNRGRWCSVCRKNAIKAME